MKYIIAIIATCILAGFARSQQSDLYTDNMEKAIIAMYKASDLQDFQESVNLFERIGKKETTEWHPRYYAAYGFIQMSMRVSEPEDQDRYLDRALSLVKDLKKMDPGNSETYTLEGFIHMMRITIDPGNRGPQFSGMSFQALHSAVNMDPDNPRAQLVLANMQMGTSRFFGQDIEESCQILQKAIQLFQNQKPNHSLDPTWGMDWAISLKDDCPSITK